MHRPLRLGVIRVRAEEREQEVGRDGPGDADVIVVRDDDDERIDDADEQQHGIRAVGEQVQRALQLVPARKIRAHERWKHLLGGLLRALRPAELLRLEPVHVGGKLGRAHDARHILRCAIPRAARGS